MSSGISDPRNVLAICLGAAVPALIFGRVVLASLLFVALASVFFLSDYRRHFWNAVSLARSPAGALAILTFLAWLPNIFISQYPLRSLEAALRTLALAGVIGVFWSTLKSERRLLDLCFRALLLMTAAAIVIGTLAQTVLPELYWFLHLKGWRSVPIYSDIKPISALSVLIIPVLLSTGLKLGRGWLIFAIAQVLGFFFLIYLTENRSAVAGLVAAVVAICLAILIAYRNKPKVNWSIGLVIIASICSMLIWLKLTRDFGPTTHDIPIYGKLGLPTWLIDFQRQEIWDFVLNLAQQSPWIGLGINSVNLLPDAAMVVPGTNGLKYIPSHPHNWVIEIFAETGIVGLIPLLAFIVVHFYSLTKRYQETKNHYVLAAIGAAAGYWGSGMFNFSFWSVWWQASFGVMIVICVVAGSAARPDRAN